MRALVKEHGTRAWTTVAQALPGRTGKQCRERWHNHLDHDIRKDAWSLEEDCKLIQLQAEFGNKWADLAKFLPGRTDNAVKNHWNSALRRGENIGHLCARPRAPAPRVRLHARFAPCACARRSNITHRLTLLPARPCVVRLVDGQIPKGFPEGIPPLPGSGLAALGLPTHVEAAKINNLLRTNPQSSLATLIGGTVTEGAAPEKPTSQKGLDALLNMLRARTPAELLEATSNLQQAIGQLETPRGDPPGELSFPALPSARSDGSLSNLGMSAPPPSFGCGGGSSSAGGGMHGYCAVPPGMMGAASPTTAALASALEAHAAGAMPPSASSAGLGIAYDDLLTPSLTSSLLSPGTQEKLGIADADGASNSSKRPRTGAALPASMPPPASIPPSLPPRQASTGGDTTSSETSADAAAAAPAAAGSNLRKKRPPGATNLTVANPSASAASSSSANLPTGAMGNALASALASGGCLSGHSLMGVLETPSELKAFASQLSPQLGLAPHAMLDFLATDDVINEINAGHGPYSPLRSARQELGKELNADTEQRLDATLDAANLASTAAADGTPAPADEAMAAFEGA